MSRAIPLNYLFLEPRPESAYRQLFVKGTRIPARTLYGHFCSTEDPWTPETIAREYTLPLEAVREAISYCQSRPPEVDEDFRREEELMEAMGAQAPGHKGTGLEKAVSPQEVSRILRR
jgi:uncharacterized protein (DUF433 family)